VTTELKRSSKIFFFCLFRTALLGVSGLKSYFDFLRGERGLEKHYATTQGGREGCQGPGSICNIACLLQLGGLSEFAYPKREQKWIPTRPCLVGFEKSGRVAKARQAHLVRGTPPNDARWLPHTHRVSEYPGVSYPRTGLEPTRPVNTCWAGLERMFPSAIELEKSLPWSC